MRSRSLAALLTLGWLALGILAVWGAAPGTAAAARAPAGAALPTAAVVLDPPLAVTPTALFCSLPVGGQARQTLTVGNHSTATLVYTVTALPYARVRGIVTWLEVTPTHGTLPPDGQVPLRVSFDAADQFPGLYLATVLITSNSPISPSWVGVPAVLDVFEPGLVVYLPAVFKND